MIADLKPYLHYKESGVSWLDDVPVHWQTGRIKAVLQEMDSRTPDGSGTLLSLTRLRGLIPQTEASKRIHSAKTLTGYKIYQPGQIVMNRMQAWSGMFGAGQIDGLVSPDYAVFKVSKSHDVRFLLYRLKTPDLVGQFALASKGIGSGFNRLYTDQFGAIPLPLPPPDEQAAIVRYLNYATGRIEQAIRAKRKLIALLNEQKQTIIHRTVTRGLDPDAPMRDSGVDWIGDIPAHWEVCPLKQLLIKMDYGTSEGLRQGGTFQVLTMSHIKNGEVIPPNHGSLNSIPSGLLLEKYDLLFNRTNSPELVGKVGIFRGDATDNITFASYLVRLRTRQEHSPQWLNYLLNSTRFWTYARSQALVSLHQANLNPTRYGQMILPIPDKIEQDKIVNWINNQVARIQRVIDRTEREIKLLQEYRTRLITDVVTGKVDVSEAAQRLPDEDEPLPVVAEEMADYEEAIDEFVTAEADDE